MADRLALGVIPGTGWSARDIQMVAREAEDAGFGAVLTAEVNNDAPATAQLMGAASICRSCSLRQGSRAPERLSRRSGAKYCTPSFHPRPRRTLDGLARVGIFQPRH
jgi:hypothetical protein